MFMAVVESIWFGTKAIMNVFEHNDVRFDGIVISGGVVKSGFWLQAHADVCNVPITVPKVTEAPCLGSAILGAIAAGIYPNMESAAAAMTSAERVVYPDRNRHDEYMFYYERYRELYGLTKDWMHSVTAHAATKQRER